MTLARRLRAQGLSGPPERTPAQVVARLLAVPAQDGRGFRLAVRARSHGTTAADVDRALTEARSLVVTWLNRGTLHLVRSEDLPWLHALTAPFRRTATRRRLAQEGVDAPTADRGVAVVAGALADAGPLTRSELGERLAAAGVPTAGQALIHVLRLAALEGIAVRGPVRGDEQAYVGVGDWLRSAPSVDRGHAVAELARRYLAGHGPADERDLAYWAGLPLRDARAGLRAIAAELRDAGEGRVDLVGRTDDPPPPPPARLLGPFDPLLHGWRSRAPVLGDHVGVVMRNGMLRAVALVDGRAAGTWAMPGGRVRLHPFAPLPEEVARALSADAADVERFFGLPEG